MASLAKGDTAITRKTWLKLRIFRHLSHNQFTINLLLFLQCKISIVNCYSCGENYDVCLLWFDRPLVSGSEKLKETWEQTYCIIHYVSSNTSVPTTHQLLLIIAKWETAAILCGKTCSSITDIMAGAVLALGWFALQPWSWQTK